VPTVERRALAGVIIVVVLETSERIHRASLSAELHDRAIGAEQMGAAAEILDLVVWKPRRRSSPGLKVLLWGSNISRDLADNGFGAASDRGVPDDQ
jgi:hypothetical protein